MFVPSLSVVMDAITEVQWQRKKKPEKGETRAAVNKAKASLKAAGKKRATSMELQSQIMRYVDVSHWHVPQR